MPRIEQSIEHSERRWPRFLVLCGLLLFAAACVDSLLPEWTLYIGPAIMLVGVIMMVRRPFR